MRPVVLNLDDQDAIGNGRADLDSSIPLRQLSKRIDDGTDDRRHQTDQKRDRNSSLAFFGSADPQIGPGFDLVAQQFHELFEDHRYVDRLASFDGRKELSVLQ